VHSAYQPHNGYPPGSFLDHGAALDLRAGPAGQDLSVPGPGRCHRSDPRGVFPVTGPIRGLVRGLSAGPHRSGLVRWPAQERITMIAITLHDRIVEGPPQPAARVPLDLDGPFERAAGWLARRLYGKELDPLRVAFHTRTAMVSMLALEESDSHRKNLPLPPQALTVIESGRAIGCYYSMDLGYWEHHHRGVDTHKLREIASWRSSEVYSPLERAVIEYSVDSTATPSAVTDQMVATLREHLSDAQVVELAALISLENYRSRTNAGLGLTSQGFKEDC